METEMGLGDKEEWAEIDGRPNGETGVVERARDDKMWKRHSPVKDLLLFLSTDALVLEEQIEERRLHIEQSVACDHRWLARVTRIRPIGPHEPPTRFAISEAAHQSHLDIQ